jgi:NADP-dependent 3-hydroxy acid dehydrogenase YdfG
MEKRIAIVTGASSGIGEATARKFVSQGFGVVGNARSADKLQRLQNELGKAFCAVPGDVSQSQVMDELFDAAVERFGRNADIVVANAGRGLGGSVKDADLSRFEEILKLNVTGTLAILQKAAKKMLEGLDYPRKAADIVILGSVVGRHVSPFSAVYGATKFAVHALSEGLRREVGPKGIRVSLIEPGVVVSGFQEGAGYTDDMVRGFEDRFGPLLYGEDIADTIAYIVTRPPHVHVSDILVRPTRQDYP